MTESSDPIEWVEITGSDGKQHHVDSRKLDRFFHGRDGAPTTDDEWDEDRRRAIAGIAGEIIVPTLEMRDTPPEGDEIAPNPFAEEEVFDAVQLEPPTDDRREE